MFDKCQIVTDGLPVQSIERIVSPQPIVRTIRLHRDTRYSVRYSLRLHSSGVFGSLQPCENISFFKNAFQKYR